MTVRAEITGHYSAVDSEEMVLQKLAAAHKMCLSINRLGILSWSICTDSDRKTPETQYKTRVTGGGSRIKREGPLIVWQTTTHVPLRYVVKTSSA